MEHPYLFLVKLFEAFGAGHFAHAYPHVVYSWFIMLLLVGFGALAAKGVSMIPTKGQNFFEVLISGLEEFMVENSSDEARWLFPLVGTVFIYIAACNLIGLVPGFYPPTASLNTTASCAIVVVLFTHVIGIKYHGARLYQTFHGTGLVDGSHHHAHRDYRPYRPGAVSFFPAFRKHDGA